MKILAIETSCDDTGIAILEAPAFAKASAGKEKPNFKVLSNIVSSQEIHKNYGGVFPMMAKREHQRNLLPVLEKSLKEAKLLKIQNSKIKNQNDNAKLKIIKKILEKENTLFESVKEFLEKYKKPNVDIIAVTNGPGLEPCLWVGVNFAKALSYFWDIPVIPVNHIEAHILVNFIDLNSKIKIQNAKSQFKIQSLLPAVSLVVSGGHTQLILVKGIGKYKIIGETRDDAAGECFDKCARILGLGYPGGPAIAHIAEQWKSQILNPKSQTNLKSKIQNPKSFLQGLPQGQSLRKGIQLPRPMINSKDYDFSFSGLKTAVLYTVRDKKQDTITKQYIQEMCFAVQDAICDVLIKKTISAAKNYKAKTIILGGGVSANQELRKQLKEKIQKDIPNTKYLIPDTVLSTDNGLMIAVAGYFNKNKKTSWKNLEVNANLRVGKE